MPVYLAADNKAHQAAKAVGAKTDRLIRIVIVSPEQTLGLNTEYKPDDKKWGLSWREQARLINPMKIVGLKSLLWRY